MGDAMIVGECVHMLLDLTSTGPGSRSGGKVYTDFQTSLNTRLVNSNGSLSPFTNGNQALWRSHIPTSSSSPDRQPGQQAP